MDTLTLCNKNQAHIKIQSLFSSILDADHSEMAHAFPPLREMPLPTVWQKENKNKLLFQRKKNKQTLFGCQCDHIRL